MKVQIPTYQDRIIYLESDDVSCVTDYTVHFGENTPRLETQIVVGGQSVLTHVPISEVLKLIGW